VLSRPIESYKAAHFENNKHLKRLEKKIDTKVNNTPKIQPISLSDLEMNCQTVSSLVVVIHVLVNRICNCKML
jgi:hypothetical protein